MKFRFSLRDILVWCFLIAFVVFLFVSSPGQSASWTRLQAFLMELVGPVPKGFTYILRAIEKVGTDYLFLVHVRQQNRALEDRLARLQLELDFYREALATHDRLMEILRFRQEFDYPVMAAQVVAKDPSGWFKSLIIDKGQANGLALDMPAVTASGLVGRVVGLAPHYAKILLLTDQNSGIDCLVQRSRERGILKGDPVLACRMEYVHHSADVRTGDTVITSGLAGIFPKGIPLGRIARLDDRQGAFFKEIQIDPAVNFSKIEEVLIIMREVDKPFDAPP